MRSVITNLIILATILFAFTSCNSSAKPQKVAEDFLNAYFAAEYENAAKYCTPELGDDLLESLKDAQALDEAVRTNIQKHTKFYKPQVIRAEQPAKKDSVIVNYIVTNISSDSLSSATHIKESRLHIIKTEDGWRVSALK